VSVVLDPDVHAFALKAQRSVAHERPRQQAGFAQHLEAVAHAEHETAIVGEAADVRP
jgi:hypothetical protein